MKCAFVLSLCFWLFSVPRVSGANAPTECSKALLAEGLHEDVSYLQMEINSLRARIPSANLDASLYRFLEQFHAARFLFPSAYLEGAYLRGVLLWAETIQDLETATRIFFQDHNSLRHFSSRIAYFLYRYDEAQFYFSRRDPRVSAVAALRHFDDVMQISRQISVDALSGALRVNPLTKHAIQSMCRLGLNVTAEEVGGFRFNNGRHFVFCEHPWSELWAAQILAQWVPDETLIAFGDPSVRQFFTPFRLRRGKIIVVQRAADFLSVRPKKNGIGFEFCIRELKASERLSSINIGDALLQLRVTVENLVEMYPEIPIAVTEILVPERSSLILKRNFRIDARHPLPFQSRVFPLYEGQERVYLNVKGKEYPVSVHILPSLPSSAIE